MNEDFDLDNIQLSDVERVDVFKTGSTAIWGAIGGMGVISITTKKGGLSQKPYAEKQYPRRSQRWVISLLNRILLRGRHLSGTRLFAVSQCVSHFLQPVVQAIESS